MPAHLQQVARGVVPEGGVVGRLGGDDEGALAGAGDGQPHGLQGPQRLAEHRPADLVVPAEGRLGGELVADGVLAALDGRPEVREHRFHGTDAADALSACLAV